MSRTTLAIATALAVTTLFHSAGQAQPARPPQSSGQCQAAAAGNQVRFAVIGDYGMASQPEAEVAAQVKSWAPDLIVTVGDNNYPSGAASSIDANIGQYYHDFICQYPGSFGAGSSKGRFLAALGNHDWYTTNAQPYFDYFTLPGNERYYDSVQGPVHFFVLNSDGDHEPDGIGVSSAQAAWLQAALAASTSPWNIVLLHHAPFSSGNVHGSNIAVQWPYEQWGADAVIAGHEHTYERILFDDFPYFVNGLGGYTRYGWAPTPVDGSEVRYSADYGAMRVDATQTRIEFRFITRNGTLVDYYKLTKPLAALTPSNFYFEPVISGLTLPLQVTNAGDGSGRLFIVQQGRVVNSVIQDASIRIFKNGALLPTPFLDVSNLISTGSERGLLALAFHPNYESNGTFYILYTNTSGNPTLARYHVSAGNADVADAGSGSVLLSIPHPGYANHNGGMLAFGPDGYLYWSTGDGGGGGDPNENAQDLSELLGKLLRLDVDAAAPYIPAGNPFVESPVDDPNTRAEIWAYGLRNPWRTAFDRLTGDLYIADVGQNLWEEVNFQPAGDPGGENYGWDMYEANSQYNPPFEGPYDPTGKVFPVAEYAHGAGESIGCSISGGYVYRGPSFPLLDGYYFYGDYCSGKLWSLIYDASLPGWDDTEIADTSLNITSFGENESGNVYVVDRNGNVLVLGYQDPASFSQAEPQPADEATVCRRPTIGVDLLLSAATRTAAGDIDISKVRLKLDGTDVTGLATVRQSETFPAARASIRYVPPTNLATGRHGVTFTYQTHDGPMALAWDFNAQGTTCTPTMQAPVAAPGEEVVPGAIPAEAPTATSPSLGPNWRTLLIR